MPVHVKMLCLVVMATVLVIAILRDVEPEIITVLAVALTSLAPAALSRACGRRHRHGDHDH